MTERRPPPLPSTRPAASGASDLFLPAVPHTRPRFDATEALEELSTADILAIEELVVREDTTGDPPRVRTTTRPEPVWRPHDKKAPAVLVVEDDASLRDLIVQGLGLRYVVYEADDGATALALLEQMDELPACIVSDWLMPWMDGVDLLQAVRADKRPRYVPVLILTGMHTSASVIEAINAGARGYIMKPFKLKALLEKVETILTKAAPLEMPVPLSK